MEKEKSIIIDEGKYFNGEMIKNIYMNLLSKI